MDRYKFAGWVGMVLFLVMYYLVSNGQVVPTGAMYNLSQVFAAAAIAYSLLPAKAWPTIVLELFFILIGLKALLMN